MRQILIDKFIVPENAVEEFTQRMNYNRNFIKNISGFVQDAAYKRTDDKGNTVVVTIAIWESEEVIKKAKEAVQTEYAKIGFRPDEMLKRLNITLERGTYTEIV